MQKAAFLIQIKRVRVCEMKPIYKLLILVVMAAVFLPVQAAEEVRTPTHADAAVVFAKYSGLFDRYVPREASLNDCVRFLNQHGIYFGLMEVVNGSEFTIGDCARVMGQIELVLTGEAEYVYGKVILPKGIDSWEDFCILHGVDYKKGYSAVYQALIIQSGLND